MPLAFEKIREAIQRSLKGKINPRTKKVYTDSEIFAIARVSYRSKYGKDI